jgi:hypothetical protein
MEESKKDTPQSRTQSKKALPKQPSKTNITPDTHAKETKYLTRSSMTKDQDSKRKTSASNLQQIRSTTGFRGQSSKAKLAKRGEDNRERMLQGAPKRGKPKTKPEYPKQMVTAKAPKKGTSNQKPKQRKESKVPAIKKTQLYPKNQHSTKAKQSKISKTKMVKQNSKKTAKEEVTETDNLLSPGRECTSPKDFPSLFVENIKTTFYPELSGIGDIHGIRVSHDNLLWVNHLRNCIQLLNTSGEVLRTVNVDFRPVLSCCTPSGDLLVTQGYSGISNPVVTLVTRDGNSRVLADLSTYASYLYGIHCDNESIYVIAERNISPEIYSIVKLSMSGEVEGIIGLENNCFINHIISLNGQIIALSTNDTVMMPLKGEIISAEEVNRVNIRDVYSATASVDNLGNVILASYGDLFIIHPNMETMQRIKTDAGPIISTAVDKNNQLWLGTSAGGLFSAQYMK